jgi:hypothetical protein
MTSSAVELRPVTRVAFGAVERALELARRRVGAADITAKEGSHQRGPRGGRDGHRRCRRRSFDGRDPGRGARPRRLGSEGRHSAPAPNQGGEHAWPCPTWGAARVSAYVLFWASVVHTAAGTLLATEAGALCPTSTAGSGPSIRTRSSSTPRPIFRRNCSTSPGPRRSFRAENRTPMTSPA